MNADRVAAALGLTDASWSDGLPLMVIEGHPVTMAPCWSGEALRAAVRRDTPLLIVDAGDAPSSLVVEAPRPWPVVAVSASPWSVRAADFGLLVG
ncbi:MAG: hypothetical protein P8N02_03625, partial [Actinomycetota bacterium]|nr:hypothetical protein [Actinomycetota bacterium]